jgi:hypothetical protein
MSSCWLSTVSVRALRSIKRMIERKSVKGSWDETSIWSLFSTSRSARAISSAEIFVVLSSTVYGSEQDEEGAGNR